MIHLVEPVLEGQGLELVDVECRREAQGLVVRVYVDRESDVGTVDLETLSDLSREISDLFDVEDPVAGPYTLEVSSPGIDRPLRKPEHFARVVGKRVRVRTVRPVEGRRSFTGELRSVTPEGVHVLLEGAGEVFLAFRDVERANYQHEFTASDFGKKSGGRGSKKGRRPAEH